MKTKLTLTVNAGSATLKLAVFDDKLKMIWSAQAEKIGLSGSFLVIKAGAKSERHEVKIKDHAQALVALISFLNPEIKVNIAKVGHRVVHGGSTYFRPTRLNTKVLKTIAALSPLARLHNPKNLAAIKAAQKLFPRAQHFGLFDTAFYHSLPPTAYLYALPLKYCRDYGVRKYGFHGLSHHYCLLQAAAQLKKPVTKLNLITLHLGSGASLTAIKNGQAIDTSMGFTPLAGVVMGTRPGDLDPGILLYLQNRGVKLSELVTALNFNSGLKGLFGSSDLRDILLAAGYKVAGYKSDGKNPAARRQLAKQTLAVFIYNIVKYLHTYVGLLGRVDAIVFTGGIGERNSDIRDLIVSQARYRGKVLIVPANEELMIARLLK